MANITDVGGGFFSRTSKNIELKGGTILHARCETLAGGWKTTTLNLNVHLENVDGKVQVTMQPPGNFIASCANVNLAGTFLQGMARREDSSWQHFRLDLDEYTANCDGQLSIGGGFFSKTSTSITFKDGKLHALCLTSRRTWVPTWLDLNFHLENIDGALRFATKPPGNFLKTSRGVNVVATKLSGSAQCFDSSWKTFKLNLDYNVANHEGRLVWLINPHTKPPNVAANAPEGAGSFDASSDLQPIKPDGPHRPPQDVHIITPPASLSETIYINRIIARWTLDNMVDGLKLTTLVESPKDIPGWRIENRENRSSNSNGIQYYNIVVQHESNIYSSVLVPAGYNVGRLCIRNALLRSRDEKKVVHIPPPSGDLGIGPPLIDVQSNNGALWWGSS